MASPRKIYKRTGLRRDKNFADLSDSKQALNNLLDTLVDTADGTFISEDLEKDIFKIMLDTSPKLVYNIVIL